jgi:tetratricopeptide (TPR) repeat protein
LDATASRSQPLSARPEPSCPRSRVFEDDERVSFRYRIRGLLGRGGMGEVYEAEDLELRERVALKVLRRELAERPGALEMLKREVALARKVSHPHICRLFDVGFHVRSGASGSERICFLTMELLQGEPLSTLLRRNGRLSHNDALAVVQPLAKGLEAAHQAGIIHRDLKSANILLVPAPTGGAPRAVITDARLRGLLECDYVVEGTYSVTKGSGPPSLRLELWLQDAATGATVAVLEEHGPLEDLLPLVSRMQARLFQALGVRGEPLLPMLAQYMPSNIEALRLLTEGNEKIRQREGAAAQALFEQALALEPGVSGIHSSLAYALIIKGERGRAREELRKALAHPERLPTGQRLSLEALYEGYAPDWKRAAELYQQFANLAPEEPQSWLSLASAQTMAKEPEAALATLAKLREHAAPIFVPLLDNHEAKAAMAASDFPRAQAAAAQAVAGAEALKDELAAATNRLLEADAWYGQNARDRALEALRDAIKRFQRAGNRMAEADATSKLAEMLPAQDLRGRLHASRAAMALYQEMGSQLGTCMTLLSIADYEHGLGELRGALRTAEASVPLCRETRLPSWEMSSLSLVGRVHRSLGHLDAAEASFNGQLRLAREHAVKRQITTGLMDLAEISLSRGDLARARQLYTEAQELLQGNKRREWEKGLALDLRLARLSLEEGRLAEAEHLAERAVTGVPELIVPSVHLLRARILLAQGQYKEANAALLEAGEPTLLETRLGLRIQRARLSTARGGVPERKAAREELRAILAEARRLEWHEGQLEVRLALGEVEVTSGSHADGVSRLRALERDAISVPSRTLPQGALGDAHGHLAQPPSVKLASLNR